MEIQIRATGGPACDTCGATELIHAGADPATRDLTRVFEREILRREVAAMKLLRAHLNAADHDHTDLLNAERLRARQELSAQHHDLTRQHADELAALGQRAEAAKVDVARWRVARRRRERLFAERIDSVVAELLDTTRR